MSGRLERIWLKRARRGPMDPADAATLTEGKGVRGSANFGSQRQVTIISVERWLEMMAELDADVDPSARRAELLVSGVDLERSRDRLLSVGACVLRIGGETRPCERMDEAWPGLRDVMSRRWGGGVWAEVVRGGDVRVSDPVSWHAELFPDMPAESRPV
jgi:MOSC domain-containing protein YiiM